MPKTYLVTGAAGFIGSHTVQRLLARGDQVVGLDNFNDYYDPLIKRQNVADMTAPELTMVEADFRDLEALAQVFATRRFEAIIHLGAMAGVRASVDNPQLYYDVNLSGTLKLLDLARKHDRPNVVFASTSSAYGRTPRIPFVENDAADRPLAPYPASKRAAELLGYSYHHLHGLDFTALRFFTVYGPRCRPDMMAYKVLDSVHSGREVPLYENGQMHRDWTYVDDIVSGIVAAADRRLGYEIINLGRGQPVLLADFVRAIEDLSGKKACLVSKPMPDADVSYTYASIDKARRLLDYSPQVEVTEGVLRSYDWFHTRIAGGSGLSS